jgi:hypothetical protein
MAAHDSGARSVACSGPAAAQPVGPLAQWDR